MPRKCPLEARNATWAVIRGWARVSLLLEPSKCDCGPARDGGHPEPPKLARYWVK
jgi:hypothetical protein